LPSQRSSRSDIINIESEEEEEEVEDSMVMEDLSLEQSEIRGLPLLDGTLIHRNPSSDAVLWDFGRQRHYNIGRTQVESGSPWDLHASSAVTTLAVADSLSISFVSRRRRGRPSPGPRTDPSQY
jgi:hypothetical protein